MRQILSALRRVVPLLLVVLLFWTVRFGAAVEPPAPAAPAAASETAATPLVWVQFTDVHQSRGSGSHKGRYDAWLSALRYVHDVVRPEFAVATGDLTDGNHFWKNQAPEDWADYRRAIDTAGFTNANYYDLPGNHDARHDCTFAHYLRSGVSGAVMHTWRREVGPYKYTFIATQTAHCGSEEGSFLPDARAWTEGQLRSAEDDTLVFVFSHHPSRLKPDAGLLGPKGLLARYRVEALVAGHLHRDSETRVDGTNIITTCNEFRALPNAYGRMRLFVLTGKTWATAPKYALHHGPQVIIAGPQDMRLADARHPDAYRVHGPTRITAMAFSEAPVDLDAIVDNRAPQRMTTADHRLYATTFDFNAAAHGVHAIRVQLSRRPDSMNGVDTIRVESY
jgi:hypothetical protein